MKRWFNMSVWDFDKEVANEFNNKYKITMKKIKVNELELYQFSIQIQILILVLYCLLKLKMISLSLISITTKNMKTDNKLAQ